EGSVDRTGRCAAGARQRGYGGVRRPRPCRQTSVSSYSGRMSAARPLRDVFDELASGGAAATGPADLRQVMAASGYDDLPDALLAEAIVNYADSAPLPVAEQLAPFVQAHSPVSGDAVPRSEEHTSELQSRENLV